MSEESQEFDQQLREELVRTGEEKALSEKEKTNDLWKPQEQFAFFWKEDVRNAVDMEELLLERFILGLITQQRFWKERKEIFGDLK